MRALLQRQLEGDRYRLIGAADGARALAAAQAQHVDAALLDALMPGMDGSEVAAALRESELTRTLSIIMVTALEDRVSRLRAFRAGAQEFLTKPVDSAEVSLRVDNILKPKQYVDLLSGQNRQLEEMVCDRSREALESYRETIAALCRARAYKDEGTGGHVNRISYYTEQIATVLGMNADFCETVHYASPMHVLARSQCPTRSCSSAACCATANGGL